PKAGWNHGVLWYHDDSVTDEIVVGVKIGLLAFRRDDDPISDPRVLVDDRTVDDTIASNPDRRQVGRLLRRGAFEMIAAHDHALGNRSTAPDDAAPTDHATFDMRVGDDAAGRNDRLAEGRGGDFTSRQKTRVSVDWRLGLEKAVLRVQIRQVEIGILE